MDRWIVASGGARIWVEGGAKFIYDIYTYTNLCEYIIFETNLKN